jgi:serine/threonine-protein kinase RsbW
MAVHSSNRMEKIETTLESTLDSVDEEERIVMQSAEKLGFDEEMQQQIGMAVRECMVNAVVHGAVSRVVHPSVRVARGAEA